MRKLETILGGDLIEKDRLIDHARKSKPPVCAPAPAINDESSGSAPAPPARHSARHSQHLGRSAADDHRCCREAGASSFSIDCWRARSGQLGSCVLFADNADMGAMASGPRSGQVSLRPERGGVVAISSRTGCFRSTSSRALDRAKQPYEIVFSAFDGSRSPRRRGGRMHGHARSRSRPHW